MYVIYENKSGPKGENYSNAINEGIKKLICDKDCNKDMVLFDDETRNSGLHIEASYLCHGIWHKIMKNNRKLSAGNCFIWESDGMGKLVFHFDIMNNPSKKNNRYSCGLFKDCDNELRKKVINIYHSIGNMVPIPWFKITGGNYINGQSLHQSLDERWDMFLQLLKNNWSEWNTNQCKLTFESYMIMTCQQVYYEEIYNEAVDLKNISLDNIAAWNAKITCDSKIISFTPVEKESVDDSINKILRIIELRCEIIRLMLEKENR